MSLLLEYVLLELHPVVNCTGVEIGRALASRQKQTYIKDGVVMTMSGPVQPKVDPVQHNAAKKKLQEKLNNAKGDRGGGGGGEEGGTGGGKKKKK